MTQQLWTLAYEDGTAMVYVLEPDGVDIEAELMKLEDSICAKIDRSDVVVETGLTLTDEVEDGDRLVFTFVPPAECRYAVRRD